MAYRYEIQIHLPIIDTRHLVWNTVAFRARKLEFLILV